MGSSSSKFRKHLNNGDEVAALQLYNNNSDLRKALDPNSSYGDSHNHDTPLHYAAKHGMKSLLRIFLHDHHGNPNKTNALKETCLHCVCMEKVTHAQFYPVQRKRLECLLMLLKWKGPEVIDGQQEKVDMAYQDESQNTALHYAASSGLKYCVETLVQYGAPLFMENSSQETPCDAAERGGHAEIALYLESKMVFSNVGNEDDNEDAVSYIEAEDYSGLRAQDLQEAKDQLLVETADMLSVPLFTAEALLRNHEWSREMLLEAWMTDPMSCCEKSGVIPPPSVFCDKPVPQDTLRSPTKSEAAYTSMMCDICTQVFSYNKEVVEISCEHQFCTDCWTEYLNLKIQEGDAHHITCPAYQCERLVPVEMIERIVSRDMARRYLQFDIKAFVDSNPNIKWCPYPGCGRAVKLPELEDSGRSQVTRRMAPSDTSRAVDCGNGHYFCWDCSGEAHEPSSCENWTKWYSKVAEIKPEELSGTEEQTMSAANCLWLVTNSKPCPNCKSPIQKNEGCNHMKCSKCKHDFCWVCLDQWKRHNSSTGGYFKCNRYEAVKVVQEETQKAQSTAEDVNQKMQELNKFVHYYTRFKNHENSYKFEEPLLNTTKSKMLKLAEAVTDLATAYSETQFVENAVQQLLKARRVLKCSYVYGYYLDGPGYKKIVFEFMQTELEECTEILSQMVNRLYLRTPRKKIIEQAHIVQRKRHEFILAISKGLVPPETPPGLRKHRRRKYSMDFEDEELRKAILASMQDMDLANPWIKDASGRHTNVMAVLDWPDSDDSDSESFYTTQHGRCKRKTCKKPRAKNPRTGDIHEYCSRQCMYDDKLETPEPSEPVQEVIMDEQMDLLRALEMSRLQFLHDQGIISGERSSISASLLDSPGSTEDPKDSQESCTSSTRQKSPHSRQKSPKKSPGSGGKKGKGKGKRSIQAAMEQLDLEIQRVLELSSISPSELQESMNTQSLAMPSLSHAPPPVENQPTVSPDHASGRRRSRFDEPPLSSCVQSPPNRSVQDMLHDDCLNCLIIGDEPPSPFGRSSIPNDPTRLTNQSTSRISDLHPLPDNIQSPGSLSASSELHNPETNPLSTSSCFGVIKDLSISNLHVEDESSKLFPQKDINFIVQKNDSTASNCLGSSHEELPVTKRSYLLSDPSLNLLSLDSELESSEIDKSPVMKQKERVTKQKSFLSAIAANTPGEDETERLVLCSPAESQAEHTISCDSQDSPFEHSFPNTDQFIKHSPAEVLDEVLDDDVCLNENSASVQEECVSEASAGDMDHFQSIRNQTNDYSADFIQSLLVDKSNYENKSEKRQIEVSQSNRVVDDNMTFDDVLQCESRDNIYQSESDNIQSQELLQVIDNYNNKSQELLQMIDSHYNQSNRALLSEGGAYNTNPHHDISQKDMDSIVKEDNEEGLDQSIRRPQTNSSENEQNLPLDDEESSDEIQDQTYFI